MESELKKLDEIFIRYLPNKSYKLEPIYVYDWLILGNLNDALTMKTDAVLSVFNEGDNFKDQFSKKIWLNLYAYDNVEQNIEQYFNQAFEFLDRMEKENKTCIIHCHAGINRSATIVLAYFMKKMNIKLFDAYEFLSLLRPGIIYNIGFRKQLINYAKNNNLL
jgi:dual specificity MAP kinase phosphatase